MGEPLQFPLDIEEPSEDAEYEELRAELNKLIIDFSEERDVPFGMMALLLVDLGVGSRMIEYLVATAKPSGMGLKLDLDRFRRQIDDFIRGHKRDADDLVRRTRDALATGLVRVEGSDDSERG